MPGASQAVLDAEVRHAIGLQRAIAGETRLRVAQWRRDLDAIASLYVSRGLRPPRAELDGLVDRIEAFVVNSYRRQAELLTAALVGLVSLEAGFQVGLLESVTPRVLEVARPPDAELELIKDKSLGDHGLEAWALILGFQHFQRVRDRLVDVVREGGDAADAVKGLETAVRRGRHHLATWARSMLGLGAGEARDAVFEANRGLFRSFMWSGVLDSRITPHICLPRDGKLYDADTREPIGHDLPWGAGPGRIHMRCRSISSPVFHGATVLGLEGEPRETREAYSGTVPFKVTAEQWLRRQPRADVDQVFGRERARRWLGGELEAEDMLRPDGRSFFTLDELERFDAAAPPPAIGGFA